MEKLGKRKQRMFGYIAVLILMIISLTAAGIHTYVKNAYKGRIITPEQAVDLEADCILVLGAGVWGTRPSHALEDRLIQGVDLYWKGVSDKLLMSGDHGSADYDEVNVMKRYAVERDVPSEDVFMDHAGFSTYESLIRAREVFQVKKVVIVTQEFHLYRSLYIANKLGLEAYGVSSDFRVYTDEAYMEKREVLARIKDFFSVLFRFTPANMGEPIPIDGNGDITNDEYT